MSKHRFEHKPYAQPGIIRKPTSSSAGEQHETRSQPLRPIGSSGNHLSSDQLDIPAFLRKGTRNNHE